MCSGLQHRPVRELREQALLLLDARRRLADEVIGRFSRRVLAGLRIPAEARVVLLSLPLVREDSLGTPPVHAPSYSVDRPRDIDSGNHEWIFDQTVVQELTRSRRGGTDRNANRRRTQALAAPHLRIKNRRGRDRGANAVSRRRPASAAALSCSASSFWTSLGVRQAVRPKLLPR